MKAARRLSPYTPRTVRPRFLPAALPFLAALLAPAPAAAQPFADPGPGAGLLGFYARTTDAAHGTFLGGAKGLTRLSGVLGVELFVGYRSDTYTRDGTPALRVQQIPVQLSLLAYLTPNLRVQPYLLGGGGYYRVWASGEGSLAGESTIENKLGLHVGAGVDIRVATRLSLRVEGRYVFLNLDSVTTIGASANSWQAGGGFNVYF